MLSRLTRTVRSSVTDGGLRSEDIVLWNKSVGDKAERGNFLDFNYGAIELF